VGVAIALIAALIVLVILIKITFTLIGLAFTLLVAAVIGFLAGYIVPGRLPYGVLGAIVAGLAGSWIGTLLIGSIPPHIGGIAVIPAIVGAVILAFGLRLIGSVAGRL